VEEEEGKKQKEEEKVGGGRERDEEEAGRALHDVQCRSHNKTPSCAAFTTLSALILVPHLVGASPGLCRSV
jgi:hypothetical protein